MRLKHKLFGETFIYGLSRYASLVAAIFLTPIYTRILSKQDYGVMDIFNRWNMFAISVVPIGLMTALVRFYPDFQKDPIKKRKHMGSILMTIILLGLVYVLLMLSIKNGFISLFIETEFINIDTIYYYCLGVVFCQLIFQYNLQVLRVNHNSAFYGILSLVNFSILTGFGFYFIYFSGDNIVGFFRASFMSSIASMFFSSYVVRNELFFSFDWEVMRKMLRYSIHYLSVFFLFQLTDLFDRYLIRETFSLDEVGIYSIGSRISGLILLITGSLALAWMPRAMEIKDSEEANGIYRRMFNGFVISGFVIVCFLIIFRSELLTLFAPNYEGASDIIVLLSVFNFLMGFVYVFTLGIQISTKTWVISLSAAISILLKVGLSISLIQEMGILGIAWASVVEAVVWISIQHFYSQKFRPIPYDYKVLIFIPLFVPVVYLTSQFEILNNGLIFKFMLYAFIGLFSFFFFKKMAYLE